MKTVSTLRRAIRIVTPAMFFATGGFDESGGVV